MNKTRPYLLLHNLMMGWLNEVVFHKGTLTDDLVDALDLLEPIVQSLLKDMEEEFTNEKGSAHPMAFVHMPWRDWLDPTKRKEWQDAWIEAKMPRNDDTTSKSCPRHGAPLIAWKPIRWQYWPKGWFATSKTPRSLMIELYPSGPLLVLPPPIWRFKFNRNGFCIGPLMFIRKRYLSYDL